MRHYRFYFFFMLVFVLTGVAIGLLWARHELKYPGISTTSSPVEEEPFQSIDEALETAPKEDAAHLRQLLVTPEPMSEPSVPAVTLPVPSASSATPAQTPLPSVATEADSVVYDVTEEFENTQRLVDSYAPLRDPAVSLDTPGNRKAIEQMQKNAAKRAAQLPATMPRPQR